MEEIGLEVLDGFRRSYVHIMKNDEKKKRIVKKQQDQEKLGITEISNVEIESEVTGAN